MNYLLFLFLYKEEGVNNQIIANPINRVTNAKLEDLL